jgi:signal transduction histidine kinase
LVFRIYLLGVVQFALVLLGFALLMWMNRATADNLEREAEGAIQRVIATLGDPDALRRELDRVHSELDATLVIHDEAGRVLATNRRPGDTEPPERPIPTEPPRLLRARTKLLAPPPLAGALPPPPGGRPAFGFGETRLLPPDGPPMLAFAKPVQLPNGQTGHAFYASRNPRAPANGYLVIGLVLVVVGLASFVTARSLARPLTCLSAAAQRFGAGKLETRVRLERTDEIGEVARAFDEMADRITGLVGAEKELIANVSHELRTPLARIRVALDLAAEGDAAVARQMLVEIADDLGELEQLISDVLVASRLDLARPGFSTISGGFPLHKEQVEVFDLLERVAVRFRSAHSDRPLILETTGDGTVVQGDAVLLGRALQNLLENAHKYTPRQDGVIRVASDVDSSSVWIAVSDEGIGIAPDDLRHVFVPFFRSDKSRTRATGGFGLGLAIVKQIAEAHGGSVDIKSEIGAGTRVRIRLPIASDVERRSDAIARR